MMALRSFLRPVARAARGGVRALSLIPNEADGPLMKTGIPGPKSQALMRDMDEIVQAGASHFFVDYKKSYGNYVIDADGNRMLDTYCQIASLPLGYNHPDMVEMTKDEDLMSMVLHRPALGNLPPLDWPEKLHETLMSVAPAGMTQAVTALCGSCSNENAYKMAFMWYQAEKRGGLPTAEDLETSMKHEAPGTPDLSILSFHGSFHGRLLGCLSTTHSKAIHKVDIPAFKWPVAPFPVLKYPLEAHEAENAAEEARCLEETDRIIEEALATQPVAGMIIEPIQSEGGDRHASPAFFRGLRDIALRRNIAFIVDEVQTGVAASGHFWAHESWGLETPPDMVTFSKKSQLSGFYHRAGLRPEQTYRIFGTWMGDPVRMKSLEVITKVVKRDGLVENARVVGEQLLAGVRELEAERPELITATRGMGTFVAWDMPNVEIREKLLAEMRTAGVEMGGCGDKSVRLRPSLIFGPEHAKLFLDILGNVVRKLEF
jgi:4-aminobutyrate aminotransferase/(S)-3-amino-2-methylpropionate transaminase